MMSDYAYEAQEKAQKQRNEELDHEYQQLVEQQSTQRTHERKN